MEAPAYLQHASTAFLLPIHPGPLHAVKATAAQVTAANCAYDSELDIFCRYVQVNEAICQQILLPLILLVTMSSKMIHLDIPMLQSLHYWRIYKLITQLCQLTISNSIACNCPNPGHNTCNCITSTQHCQSISVQQHQFALLLVTWFESQFGTHQCYLYPSC